MTQQTYDDFDFDEEFDPLEVNDDEINQEEMDDDNPYDTIDYPTVRNDPDVLLSKESIFTPERQGSAKEAILALIDHNPARRPIIVGILGACKDGCLSSELRKFVDEAQEFNKSVFNSGTYCRMLERAGGLTVEVPEVSEEHEVVEDGVVYLEIKEKVDPTWTTTEEGLAVYEEMTNGFRCRNMVYKRDAKYYDVYLEVLDFIEQQPRSRQEIDDFVENFEICQHPKRYGGHFIDMLEQTDAIVWRDAAWHLTEDGIKMLAEMREANRIGIRAVIPDEEDFSENADANNDANDAGSNASGEGSATAKEA